LTVPAGRGGNDQHVALGKPLEHAVKLRTIAALAAQRLVKDFRSAASCPASDWSVVLTRRIRKQPSAPDWAFYSSDGISAGLHR
jgi:hypothetical protein